MTDGPRHGSDDLLLARLDVPHTRLDHAGWPIDAYPELPMLDGHTTMVVADIDGPGVITNIHVSRFLDPPKSFERDESLTVDQQRAIGARGVVLEITFDGADLPSVCVPLADFFADGACGSASMFSSLLVEKAPGSYNARIPMPFAGSARVALRNDTSLDLLCYVAVESRPIAWEPSLGYLHATWQRDAFPLDTNTSVPMLSLTGPGKLIGQAWTVATDDPFFDGFAFVMEGNNQFDIDGVRTIDYLGTEDAFGFAWGFQDAFTGLYAGISSVSPRDPSIVAMYRFRVHDPITFDESLELTVDWTNEFNSEVFHRRVAPLVPDRTWLPPDRSEGGGWIDYARTTYWYAAAPGHNHPPMPSLGDRAAPVLHPNPAP
ncbi:MAG TPA: DUF2961 domain-containing protein [Acidimicrobiia bacterium]|nr:DUF2961 domain-containing protein [Acidimicrobiia bacterium]